MFTAMKGTISALKRILMALAELELCLAALTKLQAGGQSFGVLNLKFKVIKALNPVPCNLGIHLEGQKANFTFCKPVAGVPA